jgi:hypothetical protein
MSAPSHLRTSGYFNPSSSNLLFGGGAAAASQLMEEQQRSRVLFPGVDISPSSMLLNFNSGNVNAMLEAKQELRDQANNNTTTTLDLDHMSREGTSIGRKRRPDEQDLLSSSSSQTSHSQLGNYMLQSSTGSIPASQSTVPATFWMVANNPSTNNNQGQGGNMSGGGAHLHHQDPPMWTFPTINGNHGLHFMNFAPPVALLPSQVQLGTSGISTGGGGGGGTIADSHLGMLAALNNAYRPILGGGAPVNGQHPSHDADEEHHDDHSNASQR